ncbi:molybdopterin/thiamine biosynthesis adenylyltransferase [Paenibacillus forsythiae]|uniref:Molybdopterin/thiamine biosynthesis adenylyltransferase n=1 Tax=Paenibacillus forsythiae TaxID=365616 RepID=A0ABU3H2Y8_9BACL|nr:ThiF family adenylyltransferase [Paenibacillus forsythiae]MDT3425188.1 molybdopterin/thiamine biosynthesis adenylyltransferase [Paenibacillus forsythiae]
MNFAGEDRYSRQERFYGIGADGQKKLAQAKVLIIGAGALGSACAETMVRSGVGRVTLVDRDYVEWSNLQRQNLYSEQDAAQRIPKAVAAARRLRSVNSSVEVEGIVTDITAEEIGLYTRGVDLILDAADNFEVRMIVNDIAARDGIPWIYGACTGSYGISMTIVPGESACLHCLMDGVPSGGDTCDTAGIIGPAVQMTAAYQTAEALKWLSGNSSALRGTLVSFDLWTNRHSSVETARLKRADCPSCGAKRTYPYLSPGSHSRTTVLCGRDTVQIRPQGPVTLDLEEWERRLSAYGRAERNPFMLSLTLERHRMAIFPDGRVLVHGTGDPAEARSLYHRYFG